jgi:hypothetical protein
MFINLPDFIKRENILDMPYLGKVVDNQDPLKLGRVRCSIQGLLEGEASKLPWISQKSNSLLGGKPTKGSFAVPEVGAELEVYFPFSDIYSGFYEGYWQSSTTHQTIFNENYSESYGFVDDDINLVVNKGKQEIKIDVKGVVKITAKFDGSIEIEGSKEIKLKAPEIIFNNKASPVTTKAGHFNVVDFITGVEILGSPTTFGDV